MPKSVYSVDLIRQMAECDANYIRLLKLVPELSAYLDRSFADISPPGGHQIRAALAEEPEKALEGRITRFCLEDFDEVNEPVTVEIKILEAFKYTSTLEIVQKPELTQQMTNPSMLVRVYHDASTAEVISFQGHRKLKPRYARPNPDMYHVDEKMQVNQFLGEWLTHCLRAGISEKAPNLSFSSAGL
ncbi:MAG: hypothetical protein CMD92_09280 [Gammaproteobacteria bacterium]|nr:hypothetical protein [Gammaproteobacteria bacterium]